MRKEPLTLIVCQQAENWVAQCVEYDIAAQAKTLDDVIYEFQRVLEVQIAMDRELGLEPLSDVPPAPEEFRKMVRASYRLEAHSSLPRFQAARAIGEGVNRLRRMTDVRLADSLCLT
jgi:hypothetical protein